MSPRDLLVLHQVGQLALYVGKQRVVDVVVQWPSGFAAVLGSRHAGEVAQHWWLLLHGQSPC